ncbi:MAG TPA: hypothetical protein VFO63_04240, partial [Blastocatellia bacterium]|nr:hypothetical protein [Blastocatellia bacterium]
IGLYETYLIEGNVDLQNGERLERPGSRSEQNADTLRRIEERVIREVDEAAEEALRSARARMPLPETAAEGVYSKSGSADEQRATASQPTG